MHYCEEAKVERNKNYVTFSLFSCNCTVVISTIMCAQCTVNDVLSVCNVQLHHMYIFILLCITTITTTCVLHVYIFCNVVHNVMYLVCISYYMHTFLKICILFTFYYLFIHLVTTNTLLQITVYTRNF